MLKILAGRDLKIGVQWYLAPEEPHKNDGKHVAYLRENKEKEYRPCDADLYDALRRVVDDDERKVSVIEQRRVLGKNVTYFSKRLTRRIDREQWVIEGQRKLDGSDIIFFDPDNGIAPKDKSKSAPDAVKFVYIDELIPYLQKHSVVIYQHANRNGTVPEQIQRGFERLSNYVNKPRHLFALRYRRGTNRIFFVIPNESHADKLLERGRSVGSHPFWARRGKKGHFELYLFKR